MFKRIGSNTAIAKKILEKHRVGEDFRETLIIPDDKISLKYHVKISCKDGIVTHSVPSYISGRKRVMIYQNPVLVSVLHQLGIPLTEITEPAGTTKLDQKWILENFGLSFLRFRSKFNKGSWLIDIAKMEKVDLPFLNDSKERF